MFFLNSLFFSLLFYSAEFQRLKGVNTKSALESRELKQQLAKLQEENDVEKKEKGNFKKALVTIAIADLSMSLDNIVAITAIARDNTSLLIFGLILSILIMAIFATAIIKLLIKYKWIAYLGLIFLVYLSFDMTLDGILSIYSWVK